MIVTDYMCVSDIDSADLTVKIAQLLSEGWQPLGGVTCTATVAYTMPTIFIAYAQAMVKYEHQPARFVAQPDTYIEKTG